MDGDTPKAAPPHAAGQPIRQSGAAGNPNGVEPLPLERQIAAAAETLDAAARGGGTLALAYHGDADGLCAARSLMAALEPYAIRVVPATPPKGEHAHTPSFLARLAALDPTFLAVVDMGSRAAPLLPGVPALVVDHHRPEGFPPAAAVVSSYGREPAEPASLLAYRVGAALRPTRPLDGVAWVAAAGTVGDLGAGAPFDEVAAAYGRYGRRAITEAAALLNAARRAPAHDLDTALEALCAAVQPADLVRASSPAAARLHAYRQEVQAEVRRCAATAPVVAGEVALIPIWSPAQIHSLLATRWTRRLAGLIVIVANAGYRPSWVHFSARAAGTRSLLDFLAPARALVTTDVGFGHDRATGGIVRADEFPALLRLWGFEDDLLERRRPAAQPDAA